MSVLYVEICVLAQFCALFVPLVFMNIPGKFCSVHVNAHECETKNREHKTEVRTHTKIQNTLSDIAQQQYVPKMIENRR